MLKAYIYNGVYSFYRRYPLWSSAPLPTTELIEYKKNPILILELEEFEYEDKLNEITQFDLNFNINNLDLEYFPLEKHKNYYAEVFYGDVVVAAGLTYEFEINLVTGEGKISCNSPMFMMNYVPAIPNAIVANRSTIGHLHTVLTHMERAEQDDAYPYDDEWDYAPFAIARFATLEDWDVLTSVDLRGERQLYSQLQKVLKSTKNLFVRYLKPNISIYQNPFYGMWVDSFHHLIEIGSFSYDINFQLDNSNVKSMSVKKELQPKSTWLNGYGGEYTLSGVKKQLKISDKEMFFRELPDITHSSVVGNSSYVHLTDEILNINNAAGHTEYFTEIQPEVVDDPTTAQIRRAAQALYLKSSREIRTKEKQDEISIETDDFPLDLESGNKVSFQYEFTKEFYNGHNNTLERKVLEELSYPNASYYVRNIVKSFKTSGERSASITLHPRPEYHEVGSEAEEIALGRKLKADGEIFSLSQPRTTVAYYEIPISGVAANYFGKYQFTVNKLADADFGDQVVIPNSDTKVLWFAADSVSLKKKCDYKVTAFGVNEITDGEYKIEFSYTLFPQNDGSLFGYPNGVNFTMYVSRNGNWTVNDSIVVKVLVFFQL